MATLLYWAFFDCNKNILLIGNKSLSMTNPCLWVRFLLSWLLVFVFLQSFSQYAVKRTFPSLFKVKVLKFVYKRDTHHRGHFVRSCRTSKLPGKVLKQQTWLRREKSWRDSKTCNDKLIKFNVIGGCH